MKRVLPTTCLLLATCLLDGSAFGQNTDNTRRNENPGQPTAQDQSNKRSDLKITAKLRRHIMAQKGLSMNAKNVKIIDENGCIVLRGPVDSAKEKRIIGDIAADCCGNNFKNELEVKSAN